MIGQRLRLGDMQQVPTLAERGLPYSEDHHPLSRVLHLLAGFSASTSSSRSSILRKALFENADQTPVIDWTRTVKAAQALLFVLPHDERRALRTSVHERAPGALDGPMPAHVSFPLADVRSLFEKEPVVAPAERN